MKVSERAQKVRSLQTKWTLTALGWTGTEMSEHCTTCYWCDSGLYPKMPKGCTLCACCGTFMYTGVDDPMNEGMQVCIPCEEILLKDD